MSNSLVPGSLQAISQQAGQSLAESFLSADAIVIVDTSGSMSGRPYEQACEELRKLQASLPGQVAVISFSDRPVFCPGGVPHYSGGGTNLARALAFIHVADGCEMRFVVISDGYPDDAQAALREAGKFTSRIDTVYIGPEGGPGADFLRKLAAASGGQYSKNEIKELAKRVERLLLAAA